ncbi:MAG: hypothetical protein OXF61_07330 [Acidimicrobiaceae bacterium]|nr:hypothetical protein [Acidimicrobiaceae bacterium]
MSRPTSRLRGYPMPWHPRAVHVGRWLVENMPRGYDLELPDRRSSRAIPFIDGAS